MDDLLRSILDLKLRRISTAIRRRTSASRIDPIDLH